MNKLYVVILAGGSGKRLWPLSTPERPKQFLPLQGTTLLETTVNRMAQVAASAVQMVVTTAMYADAVKKLVGHKIAQVVVEPLARNTAPAILLACKEIQQQAVDPVMICVPADHYIRETDRFVATVQAAVAYAKEHENIVLIGIQPTEPATTYGYIEPEYTAGEQKIFPVKRFHEKPTQSVAERYVQSGMWWNSGIVCARSSVLMREFQLHAPALVDAIDTYETVPACSIDYAVLEKSSTVVVIKGDFFWSDVGSLETFTAAAGEQTVATLLAQAECEKYT